MYFSGMQPELLAAWNAMEADRVSLFTRLRAAQPAILQTPLSEGKWSPLQHLRHLIMAETASLAYINKKLAHAEAVQTAGWMDSLRASLLRTWFKLGAKAKAPAAFANPPANESPDQVLSDYDAIRNGLKEVLETVPANLVYGQLFRHAIAGRMHLPDALRFYRTHFRHHAKAIEAAL
jgi:hypothetical protein